MIYIFDIFKRRERNCRQLAQTLCVRTVPQHHRITAPAVTSSPAGFLEICLRAVRNIEMNHKTHIRLIDSHSECIGTYHNPDIILLPSFLPVGA